MLPTFDDAVVLVDDPAWSVNGLPDGGDSGYAVVITVDGVAWDVTGYTRSITCRRGRTRELDTFTPGMATITLNNEDRLFDPLYAAGPFVNKVAPRIPVAVTKDGAAIFTGFVEDWNLEYDPSGKSDAVMVCTDGSAKIAQTWLSAHTNTEQTAGERIAAVLARAEVGYTGATNLDPGLAVLQADTVTDDTDTAGYLQAVATTDLGRLFVDRTGTLRYRERTSGILADESVVFADTATGYTAPEIDFTDVTVEIGSEFLYNRVSATRAGGSATTGEDAGSIATYGVRTLSRSGLLFISDGDSQAYADYLASIYKDPEVRIASHRVMFTALGTAEQAAMLALEVGDVVRTVWTPNDFGGQVDRTSLVEAVEHAITPRNEHYITIQLTPFSTTGFVIGSATEGVLGVSTITY